MYVGMAVPKTTATRCRNGSMQAGHVIYTKITQVPPPLHPFLNPTSFCGLWYETTGQGTLKQKRRCRDGVTCVVSV